MRTRQTELHSSSSQQLSIMSAHEEHPVNLRKDDDEQEEEEEEEDEMDPRIQIELNRLNEASNEINKYENELDEARTKHRTTLSQSAQELKALSRNMRKTISRARAYYELKVESKKAQEETIRAAGLYQMANSIYRAAKETIMLAEEKLTHEGQTAELSAAWQEMLNHATIRVMDAEKEKRKREEEHHRTAKSFAELELQVQMNEKLYPKSIEKARPYFNKKAEMEQELERQKQNVIFLQERLQEAKSEYSEALQNLEHISEELHEKRKLKTVLQYPRQPGVGAESDNSKCPSVTEMNLGAYSLSALSTESDGDYSSDASSTEEGFRREHLPEKHPQAEEKLERPKLERHLDLTDHKETQPEPPHHEHPPTPPTTPMCPSDSSMSPQFPGFVSPPSSNAFSSSSSSSFTSSSFFTCPSTSTGSQLSPGFSSISLNQSSAASSSMSLAASPDEKPFVSPPLENRSIEGALNEVDSSAPEQAQNANKKQERERAPIKIFTAFRERFLSKPIVQSNLKLEKDETSEEDISI